MKTPIATVLISTLLLTGCATKLNPFNWFKRSTEEKRVEQVVPGKVIDYRGLVDQVTSLQIEKTNGGAIIHAVGLPPSQGYWDAELVADNDEKPVNGVLTYQFRIEQPYEFKRASTPVSREVVVGHFVSNIKLQGVTSIRVLGARNTRSSRR
ncbi:hypothetical protein [Profundibacter sp.]